ncbi:M23 family metallopeptidase [Synechococcus sp. CS-1330]|nr:M23 family metallopeptidase [Synechococcus sp. CS-1330]
MGSVIQGAVLASELDSVAPRLAYPLDEPAESLDPWGWRYSERRSAWRLHTGIDLAAPKGTVVLASQAGWVLLVESISGYGTTVLLDHGEGWQTLYAHLHQASVLEGAWLEQRQALGTVGMTGSATGPHLHFELRRQGTELLALDPTPHLPPLLPPPVLATITP